MATAPLRPSSTVPEKIDIAPLTPVVIPWLPSGVETVILPLLDFAFEALPLDTTTEPAVASMKDVEPAVIETVPPILECPEPTATLISPPLRSADVPVCTFTSPDLVSTTSPVTIETVRPSFAARFSSPSTAATATAPPDIVAEPRMPDDAAPTLIDTPPLLSPTALPD